MFRKALWKLLFAGICTWIGAECGCPSHVVQEMNQCIKDMDVNRMISGKTLPIFAYGNVTTANRICRNQGAYIGCLERAVKVCEETSIFLDSLGIRFESFRSAILGVCSELPVFETGVPCYWKSKDGLLKCYTESIHEAQNCVRHSQQPADGIAFMGRVDSIQIMKKDLCQILINGTNCYSSVLSETCKKHEVEVIINFEQANMPPECKQYMSVREIKYDKLHGYRSSTSKNLPGLITLLLAFTMMSANTKQ